PLLLLLPSCVGGSSAELEIMMKTMEQMALDLRDAVEEAYVSRCDITLTDCASSHYYSCYSELPEPSCLGGGSWDAAVCVEKNSDCMALWDFTASSVRVAEDVGGDEPSNNEVIEAICYTQLLDAFSINEYTTAQDAGDDLEFLGMFYGSWNGMFRIYPGRAQETCGSYDPRIRPWYVAASSGPKNVVLIIDTSGSMVTSDRISLAKEAVRDVLSTLTVADWVAVIEFNTYAQIVGDLNNGKLVQAETNAIESLMEAVDSLSEGGSTNFYEPFSLAFEILEQSFASEANTNCQTAILFLTDGQPTSLDEDSFYAAISDWNQNYNATIFSYSLGEAADITIPKAISCQEGGIWTYIPDGGNLREKMSGFYHYFAAGMGQPENRNFTAWVEPYEYSFGILGTTVSAPVYDTETTPWRFLGAVGVDFSVDYMEEVAGGDDAYTTVLDALEASSSFFCPQPRLSECDMQALRDASSYSSQYDSICEDQCTEFSSLEPKACMADNEYPTGKLKQI
ncbi:unnamed protein product, partial [Heterosigma akashiwo]